MTLLADGRSTLGGFDEEDVLSVNGADEDDVETVNGGEAVSAVPVGNGATLGCSEFASVVPSEAMGNARCGASMDGGGARFASMGVVAVNAAGNIVCA